MTENGLDPYEIGDIVCDVVLATAPRDGELPQECRGSWYCPCATKGHEKMVRRTAEEFDLDTVYDLGAGDLRLSAALSGSYDVVAYEMNDYLVDVAERRQSVENVEVRRRDYYEDWEDIRGDDAVFAAIGKTNELPGRPENGVGLEGKDSIRVVHP